MKKSYKNNIKMIDELSINSIRVLTMDAVQKANSGHPGAPMGLAAAGYVLWTRILKHNPKNPHWQNRDRFILSGGHASMLLYSLLYLTGYNLNLEDIKSFRQLNSKTPGHPEYNNPSGVETTTGPLGQGLANAVGMAIAERHMAERYNKPEYNIIDHYTYVLCGDGDLMEGISSEVASLAGHLALSRLICIYDSNNISIEGNTNITFTENINARFKAYNWNVLEINDGNDPDLIEKIIKDAKKEKEKPSLIILKTHLAYGSPNLQDNSNAHGSPLGENEIKITKKFFGWPENKFFFVPEEVLLHCKNICKKGINKESLWVNTFKKYTKKFPDISEKLLNDLTRYLPENWDSIIPKFKDINSTMATRNASGKILNSIADVIPNLIGGSADLAPSNKSYIEKSCDFQKNRYNGRNIRFGVREFGMAAIISGMYLHGGIRPYSATFLVFSDYMRPAIRLACIMKLPIIYIFTHDSIAVGEDGPTHQPVEHLSALRTLPGLIVIRPADANETASSWKFAINSNYNPVAIVLSRQNLPILDHNKSIDGTHRGAYIISDSKKKPQLLIIATGSEVHIAIDAKKILQSHKIDVRIVSMPSWEIFEKQSDKYKKYILPKKPKYRIIVEAGIKMGWEKYLGENGIFIGVNNFGVSAPRKILMKKFKITSENIVKKALKLIK